MLRHTWIYCCRILCRLQLKKTYPAHTMKYIINIECYVFLCLTFKNLVFRCHNGWPKSWARKNEGKVGRSTKGEAKETTRKRKTGSIDKQYEFDFFFNFNLPYKYKVENYHRVLREGDQNVTMDDLLKREGLKSVSGELQIIIGKYLKSMILYFFYNFQIFRCAINLCAINTRTK